MVAQVGARLAYHAHDVERSLGTNNHHRNVRLLS
jgi:hypothetical protein